LQYIIEKSNKLGITSYDYSKHANISDLGARNILEGVSKNPRIKNLNTMMAYLETVNTGTLYEEGSENDLLSKLKELVKTEDTMETRIYEKIYDKLDECIKLQNEVIMDLRKDFKFVYNKIMRLENASAKASNTENNNKKSS
jgi:predicted transcriptional regulator